MTEPMTHLYGDIAKKKLELENPPGKRRQKEKPSVKTIKENIEEEKKLLGVRINKTTLKRMKQICLDEEITTITFVQRALDKAIEENNNHLS